MKINLNMYVFQKRFQVATILSNVNFYLMVCIEAKKNKKTLNDIFVRIYELINVIKGLMFMDP